MTHDRTTTDALELAQLVKAVTDAKRTLVKDENASNELHLFDAIDRLEDFYKV